MADDKGWSWRFTKFLRAVFAEYDFRAIEQSSAIVGDGPRVADLIITSARTKVLVEAKLYRARSVSPGVLRNAAAQAEALRQLFVCDLAILATTARINALTMAELQANPRLVIYDYDRLAWLAAVKPYHTEEFAEIVRETRVFGTGEDDIPRKLDGVQSGVAELEGIRPGNVDLKKHTYAPHVTVAEAKPPTRGTDLCKELDEIIRTKSKGYPQAFEKKCIECLKYLFAEDLQFGDGQHQTKTGLSRFDLIARIRSENDFWNLLVTDFRCRYVVFEFKCYTRKITQGEILTTEKYLFTPALRSTAFIISTNGPDMNAYTTACGALRENGKLIINLTVDQVCKMLKAKDGLDAANGGPADVENELFVTLDEMLMGIER